VRDSKLGRFLGSRNLKPLRRQIVLEQGWAPK